MVREIMRDEAFLAQPSAEATAADVETARDLLETLIAHKEGCVGMAANMIGVSKRIIAFENGDEYMIMFNPEIEKCSQPYTAEEGCLSLEGRRQTKRYKSIKVKYYNEPSPLSKRFAHTNPLQFPAKYAIVKPTK